jgi:hypothetical protein
MCVINQPAKTDSIVNIMLNIAAWLGVCGPAPIRLMHATIPNRSIPTNKTKTVYFSQFFILSFPLFSQRLLE